jgi:hypothetical protein
LARIVTVSAIFATLIHFARRFHHRFIGTIAKMMKSLLMCVMLLTCLAAAPVASPVRAPAAPATVGKFDSFGVVPTPPAPSDGWKRILEGGTGHVARWAHSGADGKSDAVMTLELEPAKGRTAEAYANDLAKGMNGKAVKDATPMGGEPAFRVTGQKQANMPTEGLVASHQGYIYVIAAFADTPAQLPHAAIDAFARTLKFIPLADPSMNTALRGEKFPLFDRFLIEPLETMRPDPTPAPQGQISVSTYNFRAHKPDFIMNVQTFPNASHVTLEQLRQQFPGKLNPQAKVTWTKVASSSPGSISSTFESTAGQQRMKTRVGLMMLPPDDQMVMVMFSIPADGAKAVAAYEKASEKIMASIEPIAK